VHCTYKILASPLKLCYICTSIKFNGNETISESLVTFRTSG